jgi:hypothetical protein
MILLFTDFGHAGPYVGEMLTVLTSAAPGVPAIVLQSDAPAFQPVLAAHLLAALAVRQPPGTVFLAVVDPGVGTAARQPVAVRADGRWFVGPDNGLLHVVAARAAQCERFLIRWRPERLSSSFHGRDLFAPVAARLARDEPPENAGCEPLPHASGELDGAADDLPRVIYADAYGNAMTGLRASQMGNTAVLLAGGHRVARVPVFGALPPGANGWYENSLGLAEIMVNQGSACKELSLRVGDPVAIR